MNEENFEIDNKDAGAEENIDDGKIKNAPKRSVQLVIGFSICLLVGLLAFVFVNCSGYFPGAESFFYCL